MSEEQAQYKTKRQSSNLLINEPPLEVIPSLAVKIGLNEAIALQQLHYWLNNPKNAGRVDEDGNKWVYNTYAEWHDDNFPFWSEDKIQRIFLDLKAIGLVIIKQLDAKKRDMRNFYRIDYDQLCAMDDSVLRPSIAAKVNDVNMNTENTTETNSEKPIISFDLEQSDPAWSMLGGKPITEKQLAKQKEIADFEEMIEVQLNRFPLNWGGFKSTDQDRFRHHLKECAEKGETLTAFLDWWVAEKQQKESPPWTLGQIMVRWPQGFINANKVMTLEEQGWK
jgi:hypothetical protein